jgi:phosphatidylglycerol---prolipoprotein diacylglyceryl transferase
MRSILFSYGPLTIHTMSIFYTIAFLAAGYIFWKKGKEEHYQEDEFFDAFLLSIFVGVFWSRVGYIVFHFQQFGLNFLKWLDIFSAPGMVPTMGFIGAAVYLYRHSRKNKWKAYEVLDFAAGAIAIALTVLCIGSFAAGIGFGNATSLPWGMNFPGVFDTRHPTQLYSTVVYGVLFTYLLWAEYRYRTFTWYRDTKHSAQPGFLFCVFCMVYGLYGVLVSFVSPPQLQIGSFAIDGVVRGALFVYGAVLLYTRTGRSLPWSRR